MIEAAGETRAAKRHRGAPSDDPAPCEGCKHTQKCATGYACRRFAEWVRTGRECHELSRVPLRVYFARLYVEPNTGRPERNAD